MKKLEIVPYSFECDVLECPPGFFVYEGQLCFRTEYGTDEIYNSAGERFVTRNINVIPVEAVWKEE